VRLASRDNAVRALLDSHETGNQTDNPDPNFDKMYLVGWQEGSGLNVALSSEASDTMNETLLLVRVPLLN
jgi:hypothetical protein